MDGKRSGNGIEGYGVGGRGFNIRFENIVNDKISLSKLIWKTTNKILTINLRRQTSKKKPNNNINLTLLKSLRAYIAIRMIVSG